MLREHLKAGIVDATVPLSALSEEAKAQLMALLTVNENARRYAKEQLRQEAAERLRAEQSEDLDAILHMLKQQSVQTSIRLYLESLAKKNEDVQQLRAANFTALKGGFQRRFALSFGSSASFKKDDNVCTLQKQALEIS